MAFSMKLWTQNRMSEIIKQYYATHYVHNKNYSVHIHKQQIPLLEFPDNLNCLKIVKSLLDWPQIDFWCRLVKFYSIYITMANIKCKLNSHDFVSVSRISDLGIWLTINKI